MKNQRDLAERFRAVHEQPGGFILPNAWDAVSALLMKQAGFQAPGSSPTVAPDFDDTLRRLVAFAEVGAECSTRPICPT